MFYKETYLPRLSEFNRHSNLSYEAILQILEAAGSHHSDIVNDNVVEGNQTGIAWVLIDWRVRILRPIKSAEEINITTWVRGKSGSITVCRDFIVTDKSGAEVILAEAKLGLINVATGKLTRISDDLKAAYQSEDRIVFEDEAPRLRAPNAFLSEQVLSVRRSDIDFNGHVHNTRYLDYALEAIPQDIFDTDAFTGIRIVYSKPVKEDDTITAKYALTESGHFVGIYASDMLCTLIELK